MNTVLPTAATFNPSAVATRTMKSVFLSLALFAASAAAVSADGIPFDRDTRRVTTSHDRFMLTVAQRAEYATERRISLTPKQHQQLAKRCPTFPSVIEEVLSHRYNDCTCCVGHPYAIMLPGDSAIAIPRSELSFVTRYGARPPRTFEPPVSAKRPSAWSRFWSSVRGANSQ